MRDTLLELLRCPLPSCALAPLRIAAASATLNQHIVSGRLACTRCDATWPIVDGVPDFVTSAGAAGAGRDVVQTTSGFAANWHRYSQVIMAQPALNDELFRDWIEPVKPEHFEGKTVLDAGCGMGRWMATVAPYAPRVLVGFDYSDVVHSAFQNTRHLRNVHVVRADIFRAPFARRAFDVAYSIGVVHHTPDPEGAFACILEIVKDDGVLAVWVYGKENNAWIENVVTPLRRVVTSRMPDVALHGLSKVLTLQLSAAARMYARIFPTPPANGAGFAYDAYARHLKKYPRPYLEHIVYDHLVPHLAQYLPREELERWADVRSLARTLTARNNNSWRLIVARSPGALRAFSE